MESDSAGPPQVYGGFHHIIIATTAPVAQKILNRYLSSLPTAGDDHPHKAAVERLSTCLGSFRTCDTIIINHTDGSLLPPDTDDRRELNVVTLDPEYPLTESKEELTNCVERSCAMATQILPGFPTDQPVYQTTNPVVPIPEDSILSVSKIARALLTQQSKHALGGIYVRERVDEQRSWCSLTPWYRSTLGPLQGAGWRSGGEKASPSGPGIWVCGAYACSGIPFLEVRPALLFMTIRILNLCAPGMRCQRGAGSRGFIGVAQLVHCWYISQSNPSSRWILILLIGGIDTYVGEEQPKQA